MMDFRESFYDAVIDGQSDFAKLIRTSTVDMLKAQLPNRPDLWEQLTPDYNPGCKRVIISDDYYPALADPRTQLETTKIKRITESGIEMEDGTHHVHDTIVLATGFRTVEFLHPIRITGTQNRSLSDVWAANGGASALYGTVVPCLPNFGMFYGPNTNLGHNSIILMIEAQSRHLNTLVSAVLDARARGTRIGLVPKEQRTKEYNDEMQKILMDSSFADPKCNSCYKNKQGKITNNWSGTVIEYQEMLSKVDWDDFETIAGPNMAHDTEEEQTANKAISASKVVFGTGKQKTQIGRVHEETLVSNTTLVLGTLGAAAAAAAAAAWIYRAKLPKRL